MSKFEATVSAPVNIACIKYWGKRDTKLILPTNSSLSVTLEQDQLRSKTTSRADASFVKDQLWLNGKEEEIKAGGRTATCITEMKALRRKVEEANPDEPKISDLHIHISSYNNFPTAAGLASSASGFAALVSSLAALYKLPSTPSELSLIARQGSGSACRSLFGGFVAWNMGSKADGSDSFAEEVAPQSHWPEMHALICIVSDDKKGTSSTAGMQRTVETSELLKHRIEHVVPARMNAIIEAIKRRDFDTFAQVTMQDSNQFHAVALDTDPPIFYMNDVSRAIVAIVVELNRASVARGEGLVAAYTYDAGPNAVIYTLDRNAKTIIDLLASYFPSAIGNFSDPFGLFGGNGQERGSLRLPEGFNPAVAKVYESGGVKGFIHTRVGGGPRVLDEGESLLRSNGWPLG
ncbi:GHMP kinase [Cantharellus anzutake]|uniref:GHMP kinase n=1 Tax=Cantharellus anzutake TaxID=1750568 RepID=UPI0019037514|nr:GHMP kinase [Cantharellus anzutake]KAF8326683.1 GHMP kinase [Cantharellus anzutake]